MGLDLDTLLNAASQFRQEEGNQSLSYMRQLLRIERMPRLWQKEHGTFAHLLSVTHHGPWEKYRRFKQAEEQLAEHDMHRMQKQKRRVPATMDSIGVDAAIQVLRIPAANREEILEVLRTHAKDEGVHLTYQKTVRLIEKVLPRVGRKKKQPKTRLERLEAENLQLKAEITQKDQIILGLRARLRESGLDSSLPRVSH